MGDKQQLPSVSYGDVLRQLLMCETIPHTSLTHIYRQGEGSGICKLAKQVAGGQITRSVLENKSDITWIKVQSNEKASETILEIYKRHEGNIQVLSPGKKGQGTRHINSIIHNIRFPSDKMEEMMPGERVVCVKNVYVKDKDGIVDVDKSVFNGSTGIVVDGKNSEPKVPNDSMLIQLDGTDRVSVVEKKNVELAYCLTVHKSQGSEYDTVLIYLDRYVERMFTNELIYTAITRAKTKLYIVSDEYCILKSVSTKSPHRYSNLGDMIINENVNWNDCEFEDKFEEASDFDHYSL